MGCDDQVMVYKCVKGKWMLWDDCGRNGKICEMKQGVALCVDPGDTSSGTQTSTDTEGDSSSGLDTLSTSETGWDTSTDSQCSGQPNFLACEVVTTPDRSYDICVSGLCVSPGCGDASCNVPRPRFTLADTNQRQCYNDSSLMLSCPSFTEDFFGQDAQYGWDSTPTQKQKYTRTTPVFDQPVVQDNVTGLLWQACPAGTSGKNCAAGSSMGMNWNTALAYCDSLDWGGRLDWRLPDPYELSSIVDSSEGVSAVDSAIFQATPQSPFWTSSTAAHVDQAWYVHFGNGGESGFISKNVFSQVRCVRAGAFVGGRLEPLIQSGERVVRDSLTDLYWQGCPAGRHGPSCAAGGSNAFHWKQALAYCEDLEHAGQTDWRLPNRMELQSIAELRWYNPAVDEAAFPLTPSDWFWSSTSNANLQGNAWAIFFVYGNVFSVAKNNSYRVRCVRGGL
jgi:hypothetical protein